VEIMTKGNGNKMKDIRKLPIRTIDLKEGGVVPSRTVKREVGGKTEGANVNRIWKRGAGARKIEHERVRGIAESMIANGRPNKRSTPQDEKRKKIPKDKKVRT